MDSTAINSTSETIQHLILEALKQNPNSNTSNGYGFALAVILSLGILCIAGIIYFYRAFAKYRDKQDTIREQQWREEVSAREKARETLNGHIDTEFDKLSKKIDDGLCRLDTKHGNVEDKYQEQDKRLVLLEYKIEQLEKKWKFT